MFALNFEDNNVHSGVAAFMSVFSANFYYIYHEQETCIMDHVIFTLLMCRLH